MTVEQWIQIQGATGVRGPFTSRHFGGAGYPLFQRGEKYVSQWRITCDRCGATHDYNLDGDARTVGWLSILSVQGRNGASGPHAFGWERPHLRGNMPADLCPSCAGAIDGWLNAYAAERKAAEALAEAERARAALEESERIERERRDRASKLEQLRRDLTSRHTESLEHARNGRASEAVLALLDRERIATELLAMEGAA